MKNMKTTNLCYFVDTEFYAKTYAKEFLFYTNIDKGEGKMVIGRCNPEKRANALGYSSVNEMLQGDFFAPCIYPNVIEALDFLDAYTKN